MLNIMGHALDSWKGTIGSPSLTSRKSSPEVIRKAREEKRSSSRTLLTRSRKDHSIFLRKSEHTRPKPIKEGTELYRSTSP